MLCGRRSVRRLHFRYFVCSHRNCTIHRNAVWCECLCVSVLMCQSIGVEKKKKNFPIGDVPDRRWTLPRAILPRDVKSAFPNRNIERAETIADHQGHAPITNRRSGLIRNDYRWLRERGVCTRPALGIYIETNPISHYVRSFKFTSKFSVYACDIKVYLHTT